MLRTARGARRKGKEKEREKEDEKREKIKTAKTSIRKAKWKEVKMAKVNESR